MIAAQARSHGSVGGPALPEGTMEMTGLSATPASQVKVASSVTKARIESLGSYLPKTIMSNDDLVKDNPALDGSLIEKVTGIQYRHVFDSDTEDSHQLAVKAARNCLSESQYSASDIEVVIVTSISRSRKSEHRLYLEPSGASALAKELGATNALSFDVANACAGLSTGILILNNLIASGRYRNGLVVSGEVTTPVAANAANEMTESFDQQFASLTVGDAGAAVVLDRAIDDSNVISFIKLFTKADEAHLCIGKPSDKNPSPAMYTDPALATTKNADYLIKFAQKELADRGTSIEEQAIDYLIPHQVAAPLTAEVIKRCNAAFYKDERSFESIDTLEKYGNTSSASLIVTLHDGIKNGLLQGTKNLLIVPMASGFVAGLMLVTMTRKEIF
jgi:3-oxoacyl-(acyl-carrier-protein) synthase III